ncbi:DUF3343 domain-containing protein [Gorillibacterium sp. CAU 1737]|uniref:DUF3343 domain-containing protein n=1 Tax=Gorillibacterium sp. CAU 1737 TaxID=3140362 RepID=UPI0032617CED
MLLIAFDSTQQALRTEMLLDYAEIESDTQPTPKSITAGCALSIGFPEEDFAKVKEILVAEEVEIRGVFRQEADGYVQVL